MLVKFCHVLTMIFYIFSLVAMFTVINTDDTSKICFVSNIVVLFAILLLILIIVVAKHLKED